MGKECNGFCFQYGILVAFCKHYQKQQKKRVWTIQTHHATERIYIFYFPFPSRFAIPRHISLTNTIFILILKDSVADFLSAPVVAFNFDQNWEDYAKFVLFFQGVRQCRISKFEMGNRSTERSDVLPRLVKSVGLWLKSVSTSVS